MMAEIVTFGEPMAVLLPTRPCRIDETDMLAMGVAGAEANVASLLAQLGHEVSFVSRVGHDPFGRRILAFLRDSGVDVSSVAVDEDRPTGLYFREWLADGDRRVYYYRGGSAASALAPSDLDRVSFTGARVVLITGITAALSATCLATVNQAVELARHAKAAVVLDPNYRAALWDPVTARRMLLPLIGKADLLLMGHEDSMAIFGLPGESAMQAAAELGAKLVVLKVGANGALALVDGAVVSAPAREAPHPDDPVGAGDAFNAGFISGWLHGLSILQCLELGNLLGAASVESIGDNAVSGEVLAECRRRASTRDGVP
jgi:2-dehydro-3-deoxygluconokinase